MNRILLLVALVLCITSTAMSQSNDYKALWKEVNQLLNDGKLKSAIEQMDQIYVLAEQVNDRDQMIKVLLAQSNAQMSMEEDFQVQDIYRYEKRYTETQDPVLKSLYANIIAKRYNRYLLNNSYRFYNRTQIQNRVDGDILTYSIPDLIEKSNFYFLESIKEKEALQAVKSVDLTDILSTNDKLITEELDAYLILSMDVLHHFKSSNNLTSDFGALDLMKKEELLGSIAEFQSLDFSTEEEDNKKQSYTKHVVSLYQSLLKEYESKKDLQQEKINLLRLRFMRQHAQVPELDSKYLGSLESYYATQKGEAKELVGHELLKVYINQLNNLHSVENWTDDKKEILSKSLDLIEAQKKSKDPEFKHTANEMMQHIEKKHLQVQLENIVPYQEEALIYVAYKNISKLKSKVIKIKPEELQSLQRQIDNEKFRKLEKFPVVKEWDDQLPSNADYMNHSIELVLPALDYGNYMLISFDGERMSNSKMVVGTSFVVSDLAYNYESIAGNHQLVAVDRNSGEALNDVTVEVFERSYDHKSRSNKLKLVFSGETDRDGLMTLEISEKTRRHNIHIKLSKGKDALEDLDAYIYLSSENKSREDRMLWFTDRAIYRPGQTVHFKGIAMEVNEDHNPSLKQNQDLEISFKDVNGQEIESSSLRTDEYGSFYGTFIIPNSGLNGSFSIGVENPWSYKFIQVEDYKRPKFKPSFEQSTESYKLGDSISLSAVAKTYSGIKLDGAKYDYKVYRESYYPWYRTFYWCGYQRRENPNRFPC